MSNVTRMFDALEATHKMYRDKITTQFDEMQSTMRLLADYRDDLEAENIELRDELDALKASVGR